MLNLTIPPQINMTPSDSTMSSNADVPTNDSPENEQFNKILAKEISEKSTNNATAPAEETLEELNNIKTLPQIPENSSLALNPKLDNDIPILNIEERINNEILLPFVATTSPTPPINASTGISLLAPDESTQQNLSRYIPTFNNYSSNGQQPYGTANSAIFDQILPPKIDTNNTILTSTDESMKFTSSEFTQLGGINNLSSTTPSALSTTSMPQNLDIDSQVGQPKWGGELAQKVVWLSSQQQQVAEIRLNPVHLGPVEVMLNINSDQATAQFVSSHLAVREAIEASLPRLREMMAENGITLGDVSVGAESFQQQADTRQNNKESSGHGYDPNLIGMNDESISNESLIPLNRHNGIVNTFA